MHMRVRIAIFPALLVPLMLAAATPDKVVPAINEIDPWQQVGQQPYEMTWTQREENPHTLVDFEDLKGWTLELYGGAGRIPPQPRAADVGTVCRQVPVLGRQRPKAASSRVRRSRSRSRAVSIQSRCGATATAGRSVPDRHAGGRSSVLIVDAARQGVPDPDHGHPVDAVVADPPQDRRRNR